LRSSVAAWNEWRSRNAVKPDLSLTDFRRADLSRANLSRADLSHANLNDADLSRADLSHTNLSRANLSRADLSHADLSLADLSDADLSDANLSVSRLRKADLSRADLSRANLSGADLSLADLRYANLHYANLRYANLLRANVRNANLKESLLGETSFSDVSLNGTEGLFLVEHLGPSHITIDTLEMTAADLGKDSSRQHEIELFLEKAGVPKEYIEFFRSRVGQPIQFYSCFISYSTKDQAFSDRLYADLRQKGIRCFLATEDLKIGEKFRARINDAIRVHDKLLVVLSEHSVKSAWVEEEVEAAFEKERKESRTMLFPIRLDEAVMDSEAVWAASIRRTRHIGDFLGWKNHDEYEKSLHHLIRDLRAEDNRKATT
jgi:hypothetical protein